MASDGKLKTALAGGLAQIVTREVIIELEKSNECNGMIFKTLSEH